MNSMKMDDDIVCSIRQRIESGGDDQTGTHVPVTTKVLNNP